MQGIESLADVYKDSNTRSYSEEKQLMPLFICLLSKHFSGSALLLECFVFFGEWKYQNSTKKNLT